MSVTNAISGIIVVGALLQIGSGGWVSFFSFIAILIASIIIFVDLPSPTYVENVP